MGHRAGKDSPDAGYISFVRKYIKDVTKALVGGNLEWVGGRLKEEHAEKHRRGRAHRGGLVA